MKSQKSFIEMLTGGHPNSLGKTVEVAETVLKKPEKMEELYLAYNSDDEVVRLRVSSALKRVFLARPEWFKKWYTRFSKRVIKLQQPSALWTYALLCLELEDQLTPKKKEDAIHQLKVILESCDDWIVLNYTMEALGRWSERDTQLKKWLKPRLTKLSKDSRKSVSKRAAKLLAT